MSLCLTAEQAAAIVRAMAILNSVGGRLDVTLDDSFYVRENSSGEVIVNRTDKFEHYDTQSDFAAAYESAYNFPISVQ